MSQIQKFQWSYVGLAVVVSFRIMMVLTLGNSAKEQKVLLVIHSTHDTSSPASSIVRSDGHLQIVCLKCGADSDNKLGRNKLKEKCKKKK